MSLILATWPLAYLAWVIKVPLNINCKHHFLNPNKDLEKQKASWNVHSCNILTDGWIDRKHSNIMNLDVSWARASQVCWRSNQPHTREYIFNWVGDCIKEIREQRITQIVTDNASSNMSAKAMTNVVHPRLFWSSCAAQTIDVMLENTWKLPKYKTLIETNIPKGLFYSYLYTFALMCKYTISDISDGLVLQCLPLLFVVLVFELTRNLFWLPWYIQRIGKSFHNWKLPKARLWKQLSIHKFLGKMSNSWWRFTVLFSRYWESLVQIGNHLWAFYTACLSMPRLRS